MIIYSASVSIDIDTGTYRRLHLENGHNLPLPQKSR